MHFRRKFLLYCCSVRKFAIYEWLLENNFSNFYVHGIWKFLIGYQKHQEFFMNQKFLIPYCKNNKIAMGFLVLLLMTILFQHTWDRKAGNNTIYIYIYIYIYNIEICTCCWDLLLTNIQSVQRCTQGNIQMVSLSIFTGNKFTRKVSLHPNEELDAFLRIVCRI